MPPTTSRLGTALSDRLFWRTAELRGLAWRRALLGCGRNLRTDRGVRIFRPGKVVVGANCWLKEQVIIDGRSDRSEGVIIGDNVIVRAGAYLDAYGGEGHISIGCRVGIGQYVYIGGNGGVEIGDDAMISGHTYIVSATHLLDRTSGVPYQDQGETRLGISIGRNAWIAANCTVLDGIVIGEDAVIGAGSVVTKDVPSGMLAFGNPARVIGPVGID